MAMLLVILVVLVAPGLPRRAAAARPARAMAARSAAPPRPPPASKTRSHWAAPRRPARRSQGSPLRDGGTPVRDPPLTGWRC